MNLHQLIIGLLMSISHETVGKIPQYLRLFREAIFVPKPKQRKGKTMKEKLTYGSIGITLFSALAYVLYQVHQAIEKGIEGLSKFPY